MAYAKQYNNLIEATKSTSETKEIEVWEAKKDIKTYALIKLYEEYVYLSTGKRFSIGNILDIDENTYKYFAQVGFVIKDKDPRKYFSALFSCYSLYTKYKRVSCPDLTKLLDDKVLNAWTYLISSDTSQRSLPVQYIGTDSPTINAYTYLYENRVSDNNLLKRVKSYLNQTYQEEDWDNINALWELNLKYSSKTVEKYVCNMLDYNYQNLQDFQKYLRGLDLKELDYKSRHKITSVGAYLGYLSNYKELKKLDIAIDKEGHYLWKNN